MLRFTLGALVGAVLLSSPAQADWAVKAIKYKNNGAYKAYFNIEHKQNGAKIECQGSNTSGKGIKAGNTVTIQLDNSDGSIKAASAESCLPPRGKEVWGVVYIDKGLGYSPSSGRKSCRKDGNKFYYDPDGATMVVETRGTTEDANRCRLVNKGGVEYVD